MTNSPSWSTTGRPDGSYASTFDPRHRQEISPSVTGSSGDAPTKPVHTSVPPEMDCSCGSEPTASYTHRNPSGGSGAPVEPTPRSRDRSAIRPGSMPALRLASRNGADVPKYVRPACS